MRNTRIREKKWLVLSPKSIITFFKKINCFLMANAGQTNLPRQIKRQDEKLQKEKENL